MMRRPATLGLSSVATALLLAALLVGIRPGVAPRMGGDGAVQQAAPPPGALTRHGPIGTGTSTNWAGYVAAGRTYASIAGTWRLPAATCTGGQTSYASFWIGLDGAGSNTVEQIGADSDCSGGAPTYYAWFEMYPSDPVNLSQPAAPGDVISADVSYLGRGVFRLRIRDETAGWSYATDQTLPQARRASAEWVVEAPMGSGQALPLSAFEQVSFSGCQADDGPIDASPQVTEYVGVAASGAVLAQPSDLGNAGHAFTITWLGN
jgi:hypothetical protein